MTKQLIKGAFKADHVGSLLRPENLHKARREFKEGKITAEQLREVENQEIKRIVDKQIEVGLEAVTDGEFRRTWWHFDFLEHLNGIEGYVPDYGYTFSDNTETERYHIRNVGKISFNPDHPHVKDFIELQEFVGDRAVAKQPIPSPNQLFEGSIRNREIYPNIEDFATDVIQAYRDALKAFYDAGCRYIQLDDVYIAGLSSPDYKLTDSEYSKEELIDLAVRVVNGVVENQPEDFVITTHLCRGNYNSAYAFGGSYDKVAPTLFAKEKVDSFFLEYDDERSGDFKALQHIPAGGPSVVLGLFTSKTGELENKENIKARIQEASQYVPLEQICLSPQCGFASTHIGNKVTEEEQWEKLKYVVELSKELLG